LGANVGLSCGGVMARLQTHYRALSGKRAPRASGEAAVS